MQEADIRLLFDCGKLKSIMITRVPLVEGHSINQWISVMEEGIQYPL